MMELILAITLTAGVGIAAVWDIRTQKIPNLLTYPMMLVGLVMHGIYSGPHGLWHSASGLLLGIGIFLGPYLMGGMGAGDAKLMGAVGALMGPVGVAVAAVLSILGGLIYALILLLVHRRYARSFFNRAWSSVKLFFYTRRFEYLPPEDEVHEPVLCYAAPIALGTLVTLFLTINGSNLIQTVLGVQLSFL